MFIRSERLFLRPAWTEDADDVARVLRGGVMSNVAPECLPRTPGDVRACLTGADDCVSPDRLVAGMLITLPTAAGSETIGGMALERVASGSQDVRLAYWLAEHRWGHGYAAEAARGAVALAGALGFRRVYADQSEDDRASLLVLTRAGFRPTGEQRTVYDQVAAVYVADIAEGAGGNDRDDAGEARAA